jgi:hypothetical protein
MRAPELEHLVTLGLVDEQEHEAALARIAAPSWRDHYRWISDEHEEIVSRFGDDTIASATAKKT